MGMGAIRAISWHTGTFGCMPDGLRARCEASEKAMHRVDRVGEKEKKRGSKSCLKGEVHRPSKQGGSFYCP